MVTMPDVEKVIKGLERCIADVGCDGCPYEDKCYSQDRCEQFSEPMMRDVLALLKEQGWISVKDRLPNCNGCYLVWRPHFYTEKGMQSICYFDGQNTWHDSYGVDFTRMLAPDDVSHWMPLPEQPKER